MCVSRMNYWQIFNYSRRRIAAFLPPHGFKASCVDSLDSGPVDQLFYHSTSLCVWISLVPHHDTIKKHKFNLNQLNKYHHCNHSTIITMISIIFYDETNANNHHFEDLHRYPASRRQLYNQYSIYTFLGNFQLGKKKQRNAAKQSADFLYHI